MKVAQSPTVESGYFQASELGLLLGKVLITWELGGGLGHLSTMHGVASELLKLDHRVAIAARDLTHFPQFFSGLEVQAFQSPYFRGCFPGSYNPPSTFPHILHNCCCGDSDTFLGLIKAWQQLFDLVRPDAVLFDHSPTPILASRGRSFYRATINNGFFAPPDESPLPSWRSQLPSDLDQFKDDELKILQMLNATAHMLGQNHLTQVSHLYAELDDNFLFTYPEFDHFACRRNGNYVGTRELDGGNAPIWPSNGGPRVFVYLKSFPNFPVVLFHLARLQLASVVYAPGAAPPDFLAKFRDSQANVMIADSAISLGRVATECDFAITNGTHGTVAAMLRAGVPTLNFPLTLEQQILCDRVSNYGMGITACPSDQTCVEPALHRLLGTASLKACARKFARKYSENDGFERFLTRLNAVLPLNSRE